MTENNLTAKQEIAAQAYALEGMTQSDAYRAAYSTENMTDKSVHELASRLFADIKVSSRVEELQALTLKRLQVTVDRVVAEYSKLAFFDIRKAFYSDGSMKPLTEIDDDTAAAIASLEVNELFDGSGLDRARIGETKKVKFTDKKAALDSLGKHLGMFIERSEVTGKGGGPIELSDAKAALLQGLIPDPTGSGTDQTN